MKKFYVIGIVAIIIIAVIIGVVIMNKDEQTIPVKKDSTNSDFIYLGIFDQSIIDEENYVFTDYSDYKNKLNSNKLTEKDFKNHNYVLIPMKYDSCSVEEIFSTNYTINENQINVVVKYKARCGVCAPEYMYYLLKVDKKLTNANVNLKYEATNDPHCNPDVAYKPIIYLYPESTIDVNIKLGNEKYLTTTYPKYNNSWKVIANPNGILIDKKTGREQYGLYWEGTNHIANVRNDGFVIKGEETIEFLEEKLSILGLTEREADEFIIYWLPKLENNKYNYVRFETMEEINNYMPLNIVPTPDTIIRVLMDYKPLDEKIIVKEQNLITPKRIGFTVVEWGGSLIN